jgi:hypothetical protein
VDEWQAAVERWLRGLDQQGTELHAAFAALADSVAGNVDDWRTSAETWIRTLDDRGTELHGAFAMLADRVVRLERHDRVRTFTSWIEAAHLATEPLVSVVMPTRDRVAFLPRSIGSVLDQRYANFELLVVDDGSVEDVGAAVVDAKDDRIRCIRADVRSPGGARNVGLDHAAGSIVAYLDDDNAMEPLWLKAIVWAFEQRPDVDVVYGGIVIDDTAAQLGIAGWEPPSLWLHDYDRAALLDHNLADTSAIAHRAGIPGARFDPTLQQCADWDMFLSVTAEKDPLALAVVACRYHSDAPDRLTHGPTFEQDRATVRRRHSGSA